MSRQQTIAPAPPGSHEDQLRVAQQRAFDQIRSSLHRPRAEQDQLSHEAVEEMIDAFDAYLAHHRE